MIILLFRVKTIFKHRKYYFYGDNNHILYLDNIANYPINHEILQYHNRY